ncbi:MAG: VWA-like domain-containing protein [Planctomycetes bacterium]|nr:VWA-like domain-containing protein [Planctomycetota bacterium]
MNTSFNSERLAEGAVRMAIIRLAAAFPFHARVLEKFRLVFSPDVETMGVTATSKGVLLLYNAEFVRGLTADVLGGVMLHEVHHVVLGHLGLNIAEFPDRWAFIVACEVSVNEFVKLPLPPGGIHLEQFPDLPPMESTLERYRRLMRVAGNARFAISGVGGMSCPGTHSSEESGQVIDNHAVWNDGGEEAAVQEAIAALVHEAAAEAGGVPPELDAAVKAIGRGTASQIYILSGGTQGTTDWRQVLRRYIGRLTQPQGSYARPPRRFPELVGIVPGRRRQPCDAAVVAILDTSGSIDGPTIEAIDGELRRLSRTRDVMVVEADCVVHRKYRYSGSLEHVQGRGGTDFCPALDRRFLSPLKPEVVVYFTDGLGPAPRNPPPWPLVWCLVPGGQPPANYGRVIRMGESK